MASSASVVMDEFGVGVKKIAAKYALTEEGCVVSNAMVVVNWDMGKEGRVMWNSCVVSVRKELCQRYCND